MGRLSKRTIQCRAARRSRDLKEGLKAANRVNLVKGSTLSSTLGSVINFNLLCEESLLRYQQTYGLGMTPGSSKEELVWAVQTHFKYQEAVDEGSLLFGLSQALKKDSSSDSSISSYN